MLKWREGNYPGMLKWWDGNDPGMVKWREGKDPGMLKWREGKDPGILKWQEGNYSGMLNWREGNYPGMLKWRGELSEYAKMTGVFLGRCREQLLTCVYSIHLARIQTTEPKRRKRFCFLTLFVYIVQHNSENTITYYIRKIVIVFNSF